MVKGNKKKRGKFASCMKFLVLSPCPGFQGQESVKKWVFGSNTRLDGQDHNTHLHTQLCCY